MGIDLLRGWRCLLRMSKEASGHLPVPADLEVQAVAALVSAE